MAENTKTVEVEQVAARTNFPTFELKGDPLVAKAVSLPNGELGLFAAEGDPQAVPKLEQEFREAGVKIHKEKSLFNLVVARESVEAALIQRRLSGKAKEAVLSAREQQQLNAQAI